MKLVEDSQIIEIVQSVFSTTLAMPCTVGVPRESGRTIDVTVGIAGAWDGDVTVRLPQALARTTAATMFMIDGAEASDEDLLDAVGEITNQVAGSVKAILPAPSDLALPTSAKAVPASGALETHWFDVGDEAFSVVFSPAHVDQSGAA